VLKIEQVGVGGYISQHRTRIVVTPRDTHTHNMFHPSVFTLAVQHDIVLQLKRKDTQWFVDLRYILNPDIVAGQRLATTNSLFFSRKGVWLDMQQVFALYDNMEGISERWGLVEKDTTSLKRGFTCVTETGFAGVDLRMWYAWEGRPVPTRKGVHLSPDGWERLKGALREIVARPQFSDFERCEKSHGEGVKSCALCE
jgi:hypothetical protein